MRRNLTLFLVMAAGTVPAAAGAQATADTLPERVVERTYDAVNRCDAAAYGSFFAPVHYEVRKGKIVHEWESDLFPSGATPRP